MVVAVELPEKQGLKHRQFLKKSVCRFNVAVELPEKQGLKLAFVLSSCPSSLPLQWNFQKNKD